MPPEINKVRAYREELEEETWFIDRRTEESQTFYTNIALAPTHIGRIAKAV